MKSILAKSVVAFLLVGVATAISRGDVEGSPDSLQGDLRVHDPVMIRHQETYYIFSTGHGVSIKSSSDKIRWEKAGRVFAEDALPAWHRDDIPDQNGHLWAPDIHYDNGKYHLYYSVSAWMNFNSSIGYATNVTLDPADPEYEWIDQGKVISFENGGEGVNVIDPNVFTDSNGEKWLVYGSYKAGLRMTQLDPDTGMLLTEDPELTVLTPSLGEGVFIIKGPRHFFIFASRGRCCSGLDSTYQIIVGRSEHLQGPYESKDGSLWIEDDYSVFLAGNHEEPGRGHNGFFAEGEETFIVYHAYTRSADGASLLNIRTLYVDDAGWPTLENTGHLFAMSEFQKRVFTGK